MPDTLAAQLSARIRDVPDFPRAGIVFKDITPLLGHASSFRLACAAMTDAYRADEISHVVGVESRGFLFAGAIAVGLGAGLVPVRKPGKLPYDRARADYALEYGTDALEMHTDAVGPGSRVVIVDDVLATGGTAAATCRLVEQLGATVVGFCFLIELSFLNGRRGLNARVHRVLSY